MNLIKTQVRAEVAAAFPPLSLKNGLAAR
jgi:hypothetical protein